MAATGLYMNCSSCVVTPSGGSASTVDGIVGVTLRSASQQRLFYGDARKFAKNLRNVMKTRGITLHGGNLKKLIDVPEDTPCTVVITIDDVVNGAAVSGGGLQITVSNAKRESLPIEAKNNDYALATLDMNCDGGSGDTDPIAVVVL